MKILVFGSSAFPRWTGDASTGFVYELSKRLKQRGMEVSVLMPHHPGSKRLEVVDGMRVYRFRYFFPSSLERLCYDGGILPNMKQSFIAKLQLPCLVKAEFFALWSVAMKEKPDVIHAHWVLPQGFTAAMVGKMLGIPVVVTAHAGDVFPLNKPLFRVLSRFAVRSAAAVTVNSNYTKAAVEKIISKSTIVVPMGVDTKQFSSAPPFAAAAVRKKYGVKGKMLLFVGRLAEKKGVTYLVEAMKQVVKTSPNCKLVVVGDGPEKDSLVRQSEPIRRNIVFAGSIPNGQLPAFYRAADVFVLPSIVAKSGDTEGMGVVLLEAIAAGTPVIASNVGGIPDIIISNKTGMLVEQKNPGQLASAIIRILSTSSLKKRFVAAARKHVSESYSWDKVTRKFYYLFCSIKK